MKRDKAKEKFLVAWLKKLTAGQQANLYGAVLEGTPENEELDHVLNYE
ncbi:MAG: hypothetical protein ABL876_07965 [Chitinophagaceae bacterium]